MIDHFRCPQEHCPRRRHVVAVLLPTGQVSADDLRQLADLGPDRDCPTHSEFLEAVSTACPPASLRTYLTTIRRLATSFGADRVDAVGTADLERLSAHIRDQALARGHTDGTGAARGFIHGSRFWYRTAQRHDLRADNPAMSLVKPARRLRPRRALTGAELADLWVVVGSSGQDPLLDLLLIDFHRDTAARRCGAIALRIQDIDRQRESVLLREKGCHQRETPLSVDVIDRALVLASERGPLRPGDALFKFRDGSPLSRRRYNSIFDRVQGRLPWAAHLGVSIHWLRHTTLTDISNAAGPRIAAAYAGHLDRSVTDAYTVPSFEDLKTAHDAVFNG